MFYIDNLANKVISSALIPIVVSATGHRFINNNKDELERVYKSLNAVFDELQQTYPNSPIILMSPLAEGADRIISEVAYSRGHSIYIILPMEVEQYKRTFKDSSARVEFDNLIDKYMQRSSNKIIDITEKFYLKTNNSSTSNDIAYLKAAEYMANNSQILIALWDGTEQEASVGTYKTVTLMRRNYYKDDNSLVDVDDVVEGGTIYHIPVEREINSITRSTINKNFYKSITSEKVFIREVLESTSSPSIEENRVLEVCRQIETFNKDIKKNRKQITSRLNDNFKKNLFLLDEDDLINFTDPLSVIAYRYEIADQLAICYHKRRDKVLKYFWIIALAGVFFFNAYCNIDFFQTRIVLMLYPGVILSNYILFRIIDNSKSHQKYIDYRVLAEGLRIQLFWAMAQINEKVINYYLLNQCNEFNWVRCAIRTSLIAIDNSKYKEVDAVYSIRKIKKCWLDAEKIYYDSTIKKNSNLSKIGSKVTNLIYFLGMLIVFFLALYDPYISVFNKNVRGVLFILVGLIPLITTIYKDKIDKNVSIGVINQYLWVNKRLSKMATELDRCISNNDIDKCQSILIQIGKESLVENATWAFFYKEKAPKVPQA